MLFSNNKNESRNTILQYFRVNSLSKYFLLVTSKRYDTNYHTLNVSCPTQQIENRSSEAITTI